MRGIYPTLPAQALAPPSARPRGRVRSDRPARVVAAGTVFRPNGAALYGLEDVRGYESLVLDRFADTYPLWCRAQPASFNLVTDLGSPFLSLLNARYAIGAPGDRDARGMARADAEPELTIFENPRALPRAFVPRRLRFGADAARRLEEMAGETRLRGPRLAVAPGPAGEAGRRRERRSGARAARRRARPPALGRTFRSRRSSRRRCRTGRDGGPRPAGAALRVETVNHAFVGIWLPPGKHTVRLTYRPASVRARAGGPGGGPCLRGRPRSPRQPGAGRRRHRGWGPFCSSPVPSPSTGGRRRFSCFWRTDSSCRCRAGPPCCSRRRLCSSPAERCSPAPSTGRSTSSTTDIRSVRFARSSRCRTTGLRFSATWCTSRSRGAPPCAKRSRRAACRSGTRTLWRASRCSPSRSPPSSIPERSSACCCPCPRRGPST